jgi:hypothetical protein
MAVIVREAPGPPGRQTADWRATGGLCRGLSVTVLLLAPCLPDVAAQHARCCHQRQRRSPRLSNNSCEMACMERATTRHL